MSGLREAPTTEPITCGESPPSRTTDVLIVGAGPYGISLSYELHRRGIPFEVVGHPFSLWRRHTLSSTHLRSDINASQVFARDDRFSLRTFLRANYSASEAARIMRGRIPVEVFRRYADWILADLPYRPLERKVTRLQLKNDGITNGFIQHPYNVSGGNMYGVELGATIPFGDFVRALDGFGVTGGVGWTQSTLDDGAEIAARRVVLASGIESHQVLPECLARLPNRLVMHSWRVREIERITGRRLLIVGGGQSAGEILAHLANDNEIVWAYRSPLIFFSEPINLPRPIFAAVLRLSSVYYFLPRPLRQLLGRRFVASTITPNLKSVLLSGRFPRIQTDAADLDLRELDGAIYSSRLDRAFDHVIACTGYRYRLASLDYLDPALAAEIEVGPDGAPRLNYDFATSVPGLYMVGGIAEPVCGPAQRFMIGCRHATLRVSRALVR